MRLRGWLLVGVSLLTAGLLVGCDRGRAAVAPDERQPPPAPPRPAAEGRTEAPVAPPPAADAPRPDADEIGLSKVASAPSTAARNLNAAALEHHRAGRHAEAAKGFQQASEAAEGHLRYRFNLACALSKQGELDRAADILAVLLRSDLPTFGRRLAEDGDLEPLRHSPLGERLAEQARALSLDYEAALGRGVPAVAVVDRGVHADERFQDLMIQAGVLDLGRRRFVPMAEAFAGSDDSVVRLAPAQRWVFLDTTRRSYSMDIPQTLRGSHLQLVEAVSGRVVAATSAQNVAIPWNAETLLTSSGVLFRWRAPTARQEPWELLGPEQSRPVRPTKRQLPRSEGGEAEPLLAGAPEGYRVEGNVLHLPEGEPIPLGRGHATGATTIHVHGPHAVVVSTRNDCDCSDTERRIHRHFVDVVDLGARRATRLAEGDRSAWARFLDDGSLLLQRHDRLERHPAQRYLPGAGELVPVGALLEIPSYGVGSCCG